MSIETKRIDKYRIQMFPTDKMKTPALIYASQDIKLENEALLQLQAEKQQSQAWANRLIGFFLGIAGSLIASLLLTVTRRRRSNKANSADAKSHAAD